MQYLHQTIKSSQSLLAPICIRSSRTSFPLSSTPNPLLITPICHISSRTSLRYSLTPNPPHIITPICHSSSSSRVTLPPSLSQQLASTTLPSQVTVSGWVKSARKQKLNTFLDLSDGSSNQLQVVVDTTIIPAQLNFHSCVTVKGTLVKSNHKGQEVELLADSVELLNSCDDSYPFQPRRFVKSEFVRQQPACKAKTNSVASLMRIRNTASQAVHGYFQDHDFVQVHTPVLTSNDCEGGGEVFTVTGGGGEGGPYWDMPVHLTVSGQLHLEAMCNGLARVYNFNPAFRAERGRTRRHLAEFWMVEAEMAFVEDIEIVVNTMEDLLKHTATKLLDVRASDLELYAKAMKTESNIPNIEKFVSSAVHMLPYMEAVQLLSDHASQLGPLVRGDLGREHEQWLCRHIGGPVAVVNWPRDTKPFYMREVGEDGLVSAVDLLVEGVGELCGGSLRETSADRLQDRTGGEPGLQWYSDMRRQGSAPSGGFGMGFERMVQFLAGVDNIKDTIPFHRASHSCIM